MPNAESQSASEMGFLEHLEELRKRIMLSVIGITVACCVVGFYGDEVMNLLLLRPALESKVKLQNIEPFGQTFLYFKVIVLSGIILAFPWILYQVWQFVAPGLYMTERKWALRITVITSICFLAGVSFGYYFLIPSMLSYVTDFANPNIENNIAIGSYFSFLVNMLLASGLIFELPMVTWVLARMGMVSHVGMTKYRRHAIVVILILAAVITPSPDPVTQMMVAIPLWILYEISVVIARASYPKIATPSPNS
ncbi:MAG: twin-arginine translocase subunit TatC [Candidatus Kapabacteria bacterium]|nr:twin-arginine translocase subunit TatC [Candidatus Kapabacteria bacterium]